MKDISYRKLLNLGTRTTSGSVNRISVPNNLKSQNWSDIGIVNAEVEWKESCITWHCPPSVYSGRSHEHTELWSKTVYHEKSDRVVVAKKSL